MPGMCALAPRAGGGVVKWIHGHYGTGGWVGGHWEYGDGNPAPAQSDFDEYSHRAESHKDDQFPGDERDPWREAASHLAVLYLLRDGQWWNYTQITEALGARTSAVERRVRELREHGKLERDRDGNRAIFRRVVP